MAVTDALDRLTIGELDAGSRLLKTDIVTAVAEHTMHKWAGLAIVAYLIDRRTDPTVQLVTYRAMTPVELAGTLGLNDPDPEEEATDADPAAPAVQTPPTPAPPAPEMTKAQAAQLAADTEKAIRQAVTVDPTAPSPVPSSPARGGPTR